MKLTLIIISYNSHCVIKQCLASLFGSNKYPAIIIDNASTDGSSETLKESFPCAEIIALKQNIGYGRATNIALRKVKTPYAMLLNPDLYAKPEDIEKLLKHAKEAADDVAILAPAVKEKDFTGDAPESVKWISGSAMLFDMVKLKDIGLFDENIFLFFEETDLCQRTVDAGHKIQLCHDVFMRHIKGQSSPPNPKVEWMKNWHFGWSRAYFFTKHKKATGKRAPQRMALFYKLKSLYSINSEKRNKYKARYAGVRAFIRRENAFLDNGTPQASPN